MKSLKKRNKQALGAALVAAAISMPFSHAAFAEAAPEKGIVAFKYLNYEDTQTNLPEDTKRITVNAFSVMGMAPIAGKWSISTTYTNDSVSGASPEYHSHVVSGASAHDKRQAVDLGVTHYFQKGTLTVGNSYSSENDYISRGYSAQGTLESEDKNTTYALGGSYTTDTINPTNNKSSFFDKRTIAGLAGVTRVLTKNDIVQLNLGYSKGRGYFDDPYKLFDVRPDRRESKTVMSRWNHHFDGSDGTGRFSYRFYTDSWGVRAHTLGAEYYQPMSNNWALTPSARYYTQTAADIYLPVDPAKPGEPAIPAAGVANYSNDQRLSAYGAVTLGIKVEKRIANEWLVDARFDQYLQRATWCLTGGGDKNLDHFSYRSIQLGLSRQF